MILSAVLWNLWPDIHYHPKNLRRWLLKRRELGRKESPWKTSKMSGRCLATTCLEVRSWLTFWKKQGQDTTGAAGWLSKLNHIKSPCCKGVANRNPTQYTTQHLNLSYIVSISVSNFSSSFMWKWIHCCLIGLSFSFMLYCWHCVCKFSHYCCMVFFFS